MGSSRVRHYPGETLSTVKPQNGGVVCCGIYGVFEHTGIWIDGNIIELRGNGLIRGASPSRFLDDRSGETISIVCDNSFQPLIDPHTVTRTEPRLFEYCEYDVIANNCHRFVWQCVSGQSSAITSFFDLNCALSKHFQSELNWCPIVEDTKDKYRI